MSNKNPADRQLDYYQRTADEYDTQHMLEKEHLDALSIIEGIIATKKYKSVLDTGCGTGRGLSYLKRRVPSLTLRGNDVSRDLLDVAIRTNGIPGEWVDNCSSYDLPYSENGYDCVIELGMLHHVEFPDKVVKEMYRVAKHCIVISDSNMYPQGGIPLLGKSIVGALLKTALCRMGLWNGVKKLITGRSWSYSEGDGVFFTYSVFDSIKLLKSLGAEVMFIPTGTGKYKYSLPLLSASHGCVIAFKPTGGNESIKAFSANGQSPTP